MARTFQSRATNVSHYPNEPGNFIDNRLIVDYLKAIYANVQFYYIHVTRNLHKLIVCN